MSSISSLSKNVTGLFCRCRPGGNSPLNRTVGFDKKISPKFFGYVESTVVSWIVSLSKNFTRVFPRSHVGRGPELLTELLHLTKHSLWNFLGVFKALQFLRFWVYQKILLDFFVELIRGGTEFWTELLDLKKKISSKFFGYVQSTVVSWI